MLSLVEHWLATCTIIATAWFWAFWVGLAWRGHIDVSTKPAAPRARTDGVK